MIDHTSLPLFFEVSSSLYAITTVLSTPGVCILRACILVIQQDVRSRGPTIHVYTWRDPGSFKITWPFAGHFVHTEWLSVIGASAINLYSALYQQQSHEYARTIYLLQIFIILQSYCVYHSADDMPFFLGAIF